jgi:hypothetical protein
LSKYLIQLHKWGFSICDEALIIEKINYYPFFKWYRWNNWRGALERWTLRLLYNDILGMGFVFFFRDLDLRDLDMERLSSFNLTGKVGYSRHMIYHQLDFLFL